MHIEKTAWEELRASRSARPGVAGRTPERREVFSSALEQAEQFFKAASVAGPETQPVLAFYGLSQAGRAIAVAAPALDGPDKKGGDLWRLRGHGIHTKDETEPLNCVAAATDPPGSSGSFVRLSELLGSPVWGKERVTLGELWDCLPGNYSSPLKDVPQTRHMPLYVDHDEFLGSSTPREEPGHRAVLSAQVANLPPHVVDLGTDRALRDYMHVFPQVRGFEYMANTIEMQAKGDRRPLFWLHDDGWAEVRMHLRVEEDDDSRAGRLRQLESITRRYMGRYYLFPGVRGSDLSMHPLMAWWAILHTLSTISRYQPAEWGRHTDVDRSRYAVPVERLLSEAVKVVPQLVAETLADVTR